MGLDACGSMLAAEIGAYGLTGMGFNAGSEDQCLWVDWNDSLHVHLSLWVGACGRDDA